MCVHACFLACIRADYQPPLLFLFPHSNTSTLLLSHSHFFHPKLHTLISPSLLSHSHIALPILAQPHPFLFYPHTPHSSPHPTHTPPIPLWHTHPPSISHPPLSHTHTSPTPLKHIHIHLILTLALTLHFPPPHTHTGTLSHFHPPHKVNRQLSSIRGKPCSQQMQLGKVAS